MPRQNFTLEEIRNKKNKKKKHTKKLRFDIETDLMIFLKIKNRGLEESAFGSLDTEFKIRCSPLAKNEND